MRLDEQRVIVTGAADSVARLVAERFCGVGARVHICDINADALKAALAAMPGIRGTVADVGRSEEVKTLFSDARDWMGEPTTLINVVGIGGPRAAIEDLTDQDWTEVMTANVGGMFHTIREAVPAMKAAGAGCIVNFSSGSTRTGLPLRTPYVVSKYAVEGLTRNLARELGPSGIRVNAILPGIINNARMRGIIARNAEAEGVTDQVVRDRYLDFISMRTMIEPAELADWVLHLASPASRHVTGQLIGVCGNVEWEI